MAEPGASGRRETRLLLATIGISVGMLLLLARFRFPEEAARQAAEPAPAPLERLAARATYDELAGIMADLERRILPAVITVAGRVAESTIYVPAVRLTPDRAVAILSGERRLVAGESEPAPALVLRDAVRELVVIAPPPDGGIPAVPATTGRPGPRYVAVVEAAGTAPSIRPVYIGRTELVSDPRWSEPLLRIAAVQQSVASGSAVFSLDGAFVGLATDVEGRLRIVPAATLRDVAAAAPPAPAVRGELPFEVQPLTDALARAGGAERGVMVSFAPDPNSPVVSGDVVRSIDGIGVTSVGGFQQVAQSRQPGADVTLEIVRRGKPLTVTVKAIEADAAAGPPADRDLGAVLRTVAGAGSEVVTVEPHGAADRAGLRRGDVIVAMDGESEPDAPQIASRFRTAAPRAALLLTVSRDGTHRVLAVEKR
jgi:serine protease Do